MNERNRKVKEALKAGIPKWVKTLIMELEMTIEYIEAYASGSMEWQSNKDE